jgi:excisionase family DNA binding protein
MDREALENGDDPLMLLEEVAEFTRLSTSTLRWLRHRGEGPTGFKLGRRLMFRRAEVQEWIRRHEQAQQ